MMRKVNLLIILMFVAWLSNAQDILYTTTGTKLIGKVVEINTVDIKYKDASNLEGPNYVVSKHDIILIAYANGSSEIITPNPPTLIPKPESNTGFSYTKKEDITPQNIYYLNDNLLSINALALANGDFTLIYDKEFLNSKLSLSFLGGYNFNSRMGTLNALIADGKDKAKKNFDAGIGINFMPSNKRRVQYFVGLLIKYMDFSYTKSTVASNNTVIVTPPRKGNQIAPMITNGFLYRISPNFNFKLFASLGPTINSPTLNIGTDLFPKIYLGYCFGYRF